MTDKSTRTWIIDPIDGTENYTRGIPVWAMLLSLHVDDVPVAAVVSAPALFRRWHATRDGGAYVSLNHGEAKRIHVNEVNELSDAHASFASIAAFDEYGYTNAINGLMKLRRARAYGDFWSHMLVAEGAVTVGLDPIAESYDLAAASLIVKEAGGKFTSFSGEETFRGKSGMSSNGILHEDLLRTLFG
jgi:histidinol-phosphatase